MFTSISGFFRLSKDGKLAEKICERIDDCVKEVSVHTYNGDNYCLNCDDFVIASAKDVSYDTCEEMIFKGGIVECYKLDKSKDLENSNIIKLKGNYFRVIKFKNLILLNNEINNTVEYECEACELKELLESVDEYYEVYRKECSDL